MSSTSRCRPSCWALWALLYISGLSGLGLWRLNHARHDRVMPRLPHGFEAASERLEAALRRQQPSDTSPLAEARGDSTANPGASATAESRVFQEAAAAAAAFAALSDIGIEAALPGPPDAGSLLRADVLSKTKRSQSTVLVFGVSLRAATSSQEVISRARTLKSPYLKHYSNAVETGMAKELMGDPFFEEMWNAPEAAAAPNGGGRQLQKKETAVDEARGDEDQQVTWDAKGGCTFQESIDFSGVDVGTHEGVSQQECCRLCITKNEESGPRQCEVAVISSAADEPPQACWLKKEVSRARRKAGVVACIPVSQPEVEARLRELAAAANLGEESGDNIPPQWKENAGPPRHGPKKGGWPGKKKVHGKDSRR